MTTWRSPHERPKQPKHDRERAEHHVKTSRVTSFRTHMLRKQRAECKQSRRTHSSVKRIEKVDGEPAWLKAMSSQLRFRCLPRRNRFKRAKQRNLDTLPRGKSSQSPFEKIAATLVHANKTFSSILRESIQKYPAYRLYNILKPPKPRHQLHPYGTRIPQARRDP